MNICSLFMPRIYKYVQTIYTTGDKSYSHTKENYVIVSRSFIKDNSTYSKSYSDSLASELTVLDLYSRTPKCTVMDVPAVSRDKRNYTLKVSISWTKKRCLNRIKRKLLNGRL